MNFRRNKALIAIAALLLIIGGILLFRGGAKDGENVSEEKVEKSAAQRGEVEVKGVIDCLPYGGASTGECVKALKGDDGKFYALNTTKLGGLELNMAKGTKVVAVGKFFPAKTDADESRVFSYTGVLEVRSLLRQ